MRVIDGMHRLRAARLRGDLSIEIEFFDGTDDEAFLAAVEANVTHGLPLTLADREAAALRLIRSDPKRSDRMLATVTGLASGTIAALRRRLDLSDVEVTARVGRDGRLRPIDAAEGRLRAQQKIRSDPDASIREIARAAGISPATASDVRRRMRSGDDPVPSSQRRNHPRRNPAMTGMNGKDVTSLLASLRNDPALRYSDPGRTLLRCLEFHTRGPGHIEKLANIIPPHCRYSLARLIRKCAEEWYELAVLLERSTLTRAAGHLGLVGACHHERCPLNWDDGSSQRFRRLVRGGRPLTVTRSPSPCRPYGSSSTLLSCSKWRLRSP
jgi:hypothetical protein